MLFTKSSVETKYRMIDQENNGHVFKFLNEVLSGDEDKIVQIANMTVDSIERDVKGSFAAYESKDLDKAHDHLHKMKSNLAHLDLKEISSKIPDHKQANFWSILPDYLNEVQGSMIRVKALI